MLTTSSNVLPLHHKQTFPPIIWIFIEGEGDGIESMLPFKTFSTLRSTLLGNNIGEGGVKSQGKKWFDVIYRRVPKVLAAMSKQMVPLRSMLRSSKREWRLKVATWGLDHRFPPSSTSSSNLIHLKAKIERWNNFFLLTIAVYIYIFS